MPTIGSQTKAVFAKNVTITIGTNTYALGKNATFRWGNRIYEEPVISADIPIYSTGVYHGEVDFQKVYSTDSDFPALAVPDASGQMPEVTISWTQKDTQTSAVTKTFTATARFQEVEDVVEEDRLVRFRGRMVLTSRPSVA